MKYSKLSLQGLYLILSGPVFFILLMLLEKILPKKVFYFISYGLDEVTWPILITVFMVVIPIWAMITAIRSSRQIGKLKKLSIENQTVQTERGHVLNLITILLSIFILSIFTIFVFFDACPPNARCKSENQVVMATMAQMRDQAELYLQEKAMYAKRDNINSCSEAESVFNDSTTDFDLSSLIKDVRKRELVKKVNCFASTTGWSMAAELKTKQGRRIYICVDNNRTSIWKENLSSIEEIQNQAVGCIVK